MAATPPAVPDIMDPGLIADPVGGYGRLREQAPLVRGRTPDGTPAWFVTRQADVRTVLSDPRFVNGARSVPGVEVDSVRDKLVEMVGIPADLAHYFADSILDYDGEDHSRLRKLVSRAFTVRRISALRPRVEEITAGLLDRMSGLGEPVDLVAEYAYPLPITVICELVGVAEEERPAWHRWSSAFMQMRPDMMPAAAREMIDHVHEMIEHRRAEPADDLLTALVQVQEADGDRLSADELVSMVITLVIAGHETTAHLIGNATYALLTHPDQLDLLRADPTLWPGAVNELMRWCGPVQVARMRYAAEDVELGGVAIRRGEVVQPVLVSSNRDPREYPEAERLDVTRRPAGRGEGHVGFGHGLHYCLGAALARQEGEVALRALVERFPRLALASDEPEWVPAPGMRRLARLPVRLGPG
ncbi:cytochrome P450 [Pseudonocardia sp. DSM 110487]|uniref:cytochrome P450 family protein n=1 Tax=Pseudonocardia sp. DSM 110487 TaxID=2865833 RepID=UPI001C6A742A|nr:cytochrome P450 [Pseudonocardia sp. DSM 110487]QYN34641.1 cytochrome P450 [Pseudonocardia sp. DSM 110487]